MNPVVHFEMPAENQKRMEEFYTKVFGWEMQHMGPDMNDYTVVTTTEVDPKTHFPKESGQINGGFYKKEPNDPSTHAPSFVIAVENAEEHIKKIKEAGGEILHGPDTIPGVGIYVAFRDTEGNRLSILQPSRM